MLIYLVIEEEMNVVFIFYFLSRHAQWWDFSPRLWAKYVALMVIYLRIQLWGILLFLINFTFFFSCLICASIMPFVLSNMCSCCLRCEASHLLNLFRIVSSYPMKTLRVGLHFPSSGLRVEKSPCISLLFSELWFSWMIILLSILVKHFFSLLLCHLIFKA